MKRKTYFCISLCILSITLFLWNCTDTELVKNDAQVQHKNFSLEEAKGFFERQMQRSFVSTRSSNGKKPKQLVTPGDFIPQWDKAVASTKAGLACYDIPIDNDIHYKAMYSTYKNGKAKAWITNVYQKLIVVKNQSTGNFGTYILNLIPDAQYDKKNLKAVANRFINCADKGGFSGIAFYTIPNLNRIIRVNRYENGVKKQGVFLHGRREQMEEKVAIAQGLLKNIVLKGKKKVVTRGYGEDDWWDNDDWWDDDDWWDNDFGEDDIDYGMIDEWKNGGGMVIELSDGWLFIDESGNSFFAEDDDGDGEPDTVVITPPDDDEGDGSSSGGSSSGNNNGNSNSSGNEDPDSEEDNNNDDDSGSNPSTKDEGKKDENKESDKGDLSEKQLPYDTTKYPGYQSGVRNCMDVSKSILKEMLGANANIGSPANCQQLWQEINGQMTLVGNAKEIFDTINSHLEQNRPILTGVDYQNGHPGNNDKTTDHWIVISGRGYDEIKGEYYFAYIESGRSLSQASNATSESNRLYYDEKNNTFVGQSEFNNKTYTLTQIRPNK